MSFASGLVKAGYLTAVLGVGKAGQALEQLALSEQTKLHYKPAAIQAYSPGADHYAKQSAIGIVAGGLLLVFGKAEEKRDHYRSITKRFSAVK